MYMDNTVLNALNVIEGGSEKIEWCSLLGVCEPQQVSQYTAILITRCNAESLQWRYKPGL